ncbi:MAG: hypothetical protein D6E12_05760 [Desulfovibrio sp.]|nr:MAG: hypothetical protein D6E12_05760 [Desulfovibrio sp.]
MARRPSTDHFIKKKVEVEDADKSATFGGAPKRRGAPFDPNTENLFLLGLAGSGRQALGQALAGKFGMQYLDLRGLDSNVDQKDVENVLQSTGWVVALGRPVLADPAVAEVVPESRAYYLIADVPLLLERTGGGNPERESLAAELNELEPLAMSLARHTLRAEKPVQELLEDMEMSLSLPLGI